MKNPFPFIQKFVEKHFMLILLTIFVIVVVIVLFNKPKPTPKPLKFDFSNQIVNRIGISAKPPVPVVFSIKDSSGKETQQYNLMTLDITGGKHPVSIPVGGSFNITYNTPKGPVTKSYNYNIMVDVVKTNINGTLIINDVYDNISFNGKPAPY
jgi:hypothetical protein